MPDPINPRVDRVFGRSINTRTETGSIEMSPQDLANLKASAAGGVLTIQNAKLADLIHSKIAEASKLVPAGKAAADVDVSVGVKVK